MGQTFEGRLEAQGRRFALVVSRFNELLTRQLLEGALEALLGHGADEAAIDIAWTPGSFEIPLIAQELASSGKYDAVVALGVVIRGETPHFDYVAGEAARGISDAARATGVPVALGVVTADTMDQAVARCARTRDNKGGQAALAAIEMANLLASVRATMRKAAHESR